MLKFFKKFLALIGAILILACTLLEVNVAPIYENENNVMYNFLIIISKSLSALGVSLVVGYFTTKFQSNDIVKGEYLHDVEVIYEQKIDPLVKNSLSNFITNPEMMKSLDDKARNDLIINALTKGNDLDEYKRKAINQIMSEVKEYRKYGSFIGNAYIEDGIVFLIATITFKKCKIGDVFENEYTFVDSKISQIKYVKFINPDDSSEYEVVGFENYDESKSPNESGKAPTLSSLPLKPTPAYGTSLEFFNDLEIPEKFKALPELYIEKQIVFRNESHWINCGWMNSCPTLGFTISITCKDGLKIKEDLIIDASKMYNIHPSKNSDKFDATTTQWVSPYTGFVITIGTDDPKKSG